MNRLFDQGAGPRELLSPIGQHVAQVIEGFAEVRAEIDAFLEIFVRPLVLLAAFAGLAEVEIKPEVERTGIGCQRDDFGRVEMTNGLSIVLNMQIGDAGVKLATIRFWKSGLGLIQRLERLFGVMHCNLNQGQFVISLIEGRVPMERIVVIFCGLGQLVVFKCQFAQKEPGAWKARWVVAHDGFEMFGGIGFILHLKI